jgi:uncharacterized protein (TIGR03437 family)
VPAQLDDSGNIATAAAGVRVFFNELPAPLLYVQSEQINVQVPWEMVGQLNAKVHVEYNGFSTRISQAAVVPYSPAFFQSDISRQGAILNEDGTLNSGSNPAKIGSIVAIFGTGAGPTAPAGVTGGIAPLTPLALLTVLPILVQVNGTDAETLYAGSAPTISSGVFQINFRVPATLPNVGAYFVSIKVGNQAGDKTVLIAIE